MGVQCTPTVTELLLFPGLNGGIGFYYNLFLSLFILDFYSEIESIKQLCFGFYAYVCLIHLLGCTPRSFHILTACHIPLLEAETESLPGLRQSH